MFFEILKIHVKLNKFLSDANINFVLEELNNLKSENFTGNVEFKFTRNTDDTTDMNITVNKSVKIDI